jgi:catechol 2,3-dioxygenase-like lactoylglutathione lyase family enzyme
MRMHHAAVVCSSETNADRFYQGILGLQKIKSSILDEALSKQIFGRAHECHIILYGNEYFAIEVFVTTQAQERGHSFEHLCLEVEEREDFLTQCQSSDVEVKRIPKGDSLLAFIEDYDGNLFEVKEEVIE